MDPKHILADLVAKGWHAAANFPDNDRLVQIAYEDGSTSPETTGFVDSLAENPPSAERFWWLMHPFPHLSDAVFAWCERPAAIVPDLTTPPPQNFRAAYIDPINAAQPLNEEKPTTANIDISDLAKYLPESLEEVVVELRVKISRVENELMEVQTTLKHYTNFANILRDKISFYFALIAQIMQALPIPKPVNPENIVTPKSEKPQS